MTIYYKTNIMLPVMFKTFAVIGLTLILTLANSAGVVLAGANNGNGDTNEATLTIDPDGFGFAWDGPPALSNYTITYCDGTNSGKIEGSELEQNDQDTNEDDFYTTTELEIAQVEGKGGLQVITVTRECTPETTDVCPNLLEVQTSLPDGYMFDDQNNCVEIPQETDLCPNLEGDQETLPEGLILDESGNCVEIPEEIDVCPNINGNQEVLPEGLVFDNEGNCVEPIGTPEDVCSNIDGIQTEVPEGLVIDNEGNCTAEEVEETDLCPNLDGAQTNIPAGLILDNDGNCVEETNDQGTDTPEDTKDDTKDDGQVLGVTELPDTGADNNLVLISLLMLSGLSLKVFARESEELSTE